MMIICMNVSICLTFKDIKVYTLEEYKNTGFKNKFILADIKSKKIMVETKTK